MTDYPIVTEKNAEKMVYKQDLIPNLFLYDPHFHNYQTTVKQNEVYVWTQLVFTAYVD